MLKSIIAAIVLVASITACSSEEQAPNSTKPENNSSVEAEPAEQEAEETVTLDGEWTTEDKQLEAAFFAEVSNGVITIWWSNAKNAKNEIYWVGSVPKEVEYEMISKGDQKAMADSFIALDQEALALNYENDYLTFEFSIGDITQTIHMQRL